MTSSRLASMNVAPCIGVRDACGKEVRRSRAPGAVPKPAAPGPSHGPPHQCSHPAPHPHRDRPASLTPAPTLAPNSNHVASRCTAPCSVPQLRSQRTNRSDRGRPLLIAVPPRGRLPCPLPLRHDSILVPKLSRLIPPRATHQRQRSDAYNRRTAAAAASASPSQHATWRSRKSINRSARGGLLATPTDSRRIFSFK